MSVSKSAMSLNLTFRASVTDTKFWLSVGSNPYPVNHHHVSLTLILRCSHCTCSYSKENVYVCDHCPFSTSFVWTKLVVDNNAFNIADIRDTQLDERVLCNHEEVPVTWGNFGQWGNFGPILASSFPHFFCLIFTKILT